MKKLLTVIIMLVIVFFYRQELQHYTHAFFSSEEEPFEWVRFRSENLYSQLPTMDFMSAINTLQHFEQDLEHELAKLEKQDEADSRTSRRRLECELAVIYRHTASLYLQQGDDEKYMVFLQKTQDQVQLCSNLKDSGM